MQQFLIRRFLSSAPAVSKDLLMRLRKSTGYTFQNCKKALEKFGDDLTGAEKWLHEEARKAGWAKMSTQRMAGNGLIGVLVQNNFGFMLELNCETDFVARNEKFRTLTTQICSDIAASERAKESIVKDGINKWEVDVEKVQRLKSSYESQCEKIDDLIAFNVGQLGERIILKRAACVFAQPSSSIFGYVHPKAALFNGVLLGQFGTIISLRQADSTKQPEKSDDEAEELSLNAVGGMLCQHIVGMNPLSIGTPPSATSAPRSEPVQTPKRAKVADPSDDDEDEEEHPGETTVLSNDKELLKQDFLLNPEMKVWDFLKNHNAKVVDFIRYECGEKSNENS